MADVLEFGWVKLHRSFFSHPIWAKPPHYGRVFQWLLTMAAPFPRFDRSFGKPAWVERGQLVTSYAEILDRVGYMTEKQARGALAYLGNEGMIAKEKVDAPVCTLVTIVNYAQYQDKEVEDVVPMGGEEGENADDSSGHHAGQSTGQGEGQGMNGRNHLPKNENERREGEEGHSKGQGEGRSEGHPINKDQEVKELINPPTPFEKGVDAAAMLGSHEDRVRLVLAAWSEELRAAGLASAEGIVGRRNQRGAEKLARDCLGNAFMSVDQLHMGIRQIISRNRAKPDHPQLDLLTLANNPDKYIADVIPKAEKEKYVIWSYTCDVCHHSACAKPEPISKGTPLPIPCVQAGDGCQGTMYPSLDTEL